MGKPWENPWKMGKTWKNIGQLGKMGKSFGKGWETGGLPSGNLLYNYGKEKHLMLVYQREGEMSWFFKGKLMVCAFLNI